MTGCAAAPVHGRASRESTREQVAPGIVYQREVRNEPRPIVVHVVRIDLTAPGLRFLATPADPVPPADYEIRARRTSTFLHEYNLLLAVNANFYEPAWQHSAEDYYPKPGDGVNINGLAVSEGNVLSRSARHHPALCITADNRAWIESVDDVPQDVQNAVAGDVIFVRNGRVSAGGEGAHPRTAVALTEDGRTMLWIVVDGRQPNYSEGVTMPELATIAISHGAHIALNLDGGGSSTLVRAEPDGEPSIINSPVHVRYPPGGERAVANHLGLKVDRAGR